MSESNLPPPAEIRSLPASDVSGGNLFVRRQDGQLLRVYRAIGSLLNPFTYLHALRLLHYYGYSHVQERRKIQMGKGSVMAPNTSLRNGGRIQIGRHCQIGERSSLWGGDSSGRIIIGDFVSLAPDVFITASDYQFAKGIPFSQQPKRERDVVIGSDVWLGARVIVTAGVTIGNGCIVGAGAVVTKDLPENAIAVGIPARSVKIRDNNVPPAESRDYLA